MARKISIIGSGNMATNLALTLYQHNFDIQDIISRTKENAITLASKVDAKAKTKPSDISNDADTVFFCVSDNILPEIINNNTFKGKILIHTAGSIELNIFDDKSESYGVMYPLQTFSKDRIADFKNTPLFIEASDNYSYSRIKQIAEKISNQVQFLDSERRIKLHIAAVFSCNFVNHMYTIASDILKDIDLDFSTLETLIKETTEKVAEKKDPYKTQTGPAIRNDNYTLSKHLDNLNYDKNLSDLYRILSNRIFETNRKK